MIRSILLAAILSAALCPEVRAQKPTGYTDPPITAADQSHWSFVAPKRPAVPEVRGTVRNPIDAFILAKLEAAGLKPAPEADRLTLIRRVTFDLIGLPPTPGEIDAFLSDTSPQAYEKLVDRLLASPHHGERWAQHWLDVVRFAESNGFELDGERPQAWRYRDYVVRSLNADKSYDKFVVEQVAGDLMASGKDPLAVADLWHATGLHRCGPVHVVSGNLDKEENRQEVLMEMVNGLGSAVLGLTIACARCHDHKFDPVSLGDYYRLQAFFAGTTYREVDLATKEEKDQLAKQLLRTTIRLDPIKKRIEALEAPYRKRLTAQKKAALEPKFREAVQTEPKKRTAEQKKLAEAANPLIKVTWDEVLEVLSPADREERTRLKEEQHHIERELPRLPPQAWAVNEDKVAPPTHVLRRGDVRRKSAVVTPMFPRVLAGKATPPKTRLDFARWLTQPDHPLTARVIVNRLWQHHFGRGIVGTPNDFGTRGEAPTHPQLLDWLAVELTHPTHGNGEPWTLKRMHRQMVTSATYRQASQVPASPGAENADPENRLLGRMNRRRLEGETLRDAVLAAAGSLTRTVGGPSVKVPLEPEVYDLIFTEDEPTGLWPVDPDPAQHTRRSLYLLVKRNVRIPLLEALDQPDTINSCAARPVSTFAPQALILMNGPFAREHGKRMAANLVRTAGKEPSDWIYALYRRALGRAPTARESRVSMEFLNAQVPELRDRLLARQPIGVPPGLPAGADPARVRALADLCLAVFNLNEFIHIN